MAPPPEDLDWTPARSGGAAFQTHALFELGDRIELQPSSISRVFVLGLFGVGVGVLAVSGWYGLRHDDDAALITGVIMCLALCAIGALVRRLLFNARVFDRGRGLYWDTREGGTIDAPPEGGGVRLDAIRGLQIVGEMVVSSESDYFAEEINLVLEDGRRINVVDHSDSEQIRADADRLSAWLGVPVWTKDQPGAS